MKINQRKRSWEKDFQKSSKFETLNHFLPITINVQDSGTHL